jgi:hypothetical protein
VKRLWLVGVLGVLAGCQERLALPSTCPDLCPGSGLIIRDTVIEATAGLDSTFTGYIGVNQVPALLVSNGLPAGNARAWAVFGKLPDSLFVVGVRYAYTIDSMLFRLPLIARDTAVKGLQIIVHRIPLLDSTVTLAELDQYLTPETAVDSVAVSDTLVTGDVRVMIRPERWPRLLPDESDTTRFAVGFRISAAAPTGVRFGSTYAGDGPVYLTYAQVPTTDTTLRKQTITITADSSNYVINQPPPAGGGNLFMGGRLGSRTILRFRLPKALTDSATVVRATLELTPAVPVPGLPRDDATIQVLAALVDVGAKSPAYSGAVGSMPIKTGATEVQKIEVLGPVGTWFGPNGLTTTLLLGLAPEGGSFSMPQFFSSRAATGRPRLRITYAQSSRPGFP